MGQSLEEWESQTKGAEKLHEELACHAANSDPDDFARLAMISVREWVKQSLIVVSSVSMKIGKGDFKNGS